MRCCSCRPPPPAASEPTRRAQLARISPCSGSWICCRRCCHLRSCLALVDSPIGCGSVAALAVGRRRGLATSVAAQGFAPATAAARPGRGGGCGLETATGTAGCWDPSHRRGRQNARPWQREPGAGGWARPALADHRSGGRGSAPRWLKLGGGIAAAGTLRGDHVPGTHLMALLALEMVFRPIFDCPQNRKNNLLNLCSEMSIRLWGPDEFWGGAPRSDPNRHAVLGTGDPRGVVQFLARARPIGRSPSRPHGHFGPESAQNQP